MYFNRIQSQIYIYLCMQSRRNSNIIKQRANRHNRLMRMIKEYSNSEEEAKKLDKIKNNTMMEINIRYIKCQHNRSYQFPRTSVSSEDDELIEQQQISRRQNFMYDLASQNIKKGKPSPIRNGSLDRNSKISSLSIDRNPQHRDKFLRYEGKLTITPSRRLSRKNSLIEKNYRIKSQFPTIRLPELKRERDRQNLKTEERGDSKELKSVLGKKLATQSSNGIKMKGVEKYLKKLQEQQKSSMKISKKRLLLPMNNM